MTDVAVFLSELDGIARFNLAKRSWFDFRARGGKPGRYPWRLYVLPTSETVLSEGDLASCHVFTYLMRNGRVIFEGQDIEDLS